MEREFLRLTRAEAGDSTVREDMHTIIDRIERVQRNMDKVEILQGCGAVKGKIEAVFKNNGYRVDRKSEKNARMIHENPIIFDYSNFRSTIMFWFCCQVHQEKKREEEPQEESCPKSSW